MRPKILVIRGGAIGDFVLTLPAIKLLRDNFPAAHLEILGYPHILALAEGRFYADAIRSIEYSALAGFFVPGSELAPDLVEYFSGFQQVISYLYDPDLFFETNLRRCGVKNLLAVSPILGPGHATHQLARPFEQLALYLEDPKAEIFPSESDRQFAATFIGSNRRPVVCMHPGSGSPRKNWPVERWRQLAEWLLSQTPQPLIILVGGEAEELTDLKTQLSGHALLSGSDRQSGSDPVRLACNLKLPHLAAILQRASLFIGHDSGISHIAAAVKTRSILIFGPTDPAVWAPIGDHIRLVCAEHGDLSRLGVERIKDQIIASGGW